MNTHDTNITNSLTTQTILNKGFLILDSLFTQNGWYLVKNNFDWIQYTKLGDETSCFEIKLSNNKVYVSIPIKNSPFQFNTSFNGYFEASEYIEQRFLDYIR